MAYISRSVLESFATSRERINEATSYLVDRQRAKRSVFLSHSHEDQGLVRAAANFLANQGVLVYVDWLDKGMPAQTNSETAERIKKAIAANDRFMMLATEKSLASRWVPWELGYADGKKGFANMAILVVKEDRFAFPGNEYVSLYPRIESTDKGGWGVFVEDKGITLPNWLQQ